MHGEPHARMTVLADIVHHEDLPRLRQLHEAVVSTRQKVAGCTDPDATNFNPVANVRATCRSPTQSAYTARLKFMPASRDYSCMGSMVGGSVVQVDMLLRGQSCGDRLASFGAGANACRGSPPLPT